MASVPFSKRVVCSVREVTDEQRIVGRTKLYQMIDDGRVRTTKVDGRRLIIVASLLEVLGLQQDGAA